MAAVETITVSGPTISGSKFPTVNHVFNGNRIDRIAGTLPAGTTGQYWTIAFPYATLIMFSAQASGGNITVKTNAADATGGDTLALIDKAPTFFHNGGPIANPLSHDVTTGVYLTNATAVPVDFEIVALNQIVPA